MKFKLINNIITYLYALLKGGCYLGLVVGFAIIFRIMVGEPYKVPSASMEDAIPNNSVIWVNKLKYGGLWPGSISEIPFIGDLFMKDTSRKTFRGRLFGYNKVDRNDIIVFIDPKSDRTRLVKRCIGLPGETISIINNRVFLNGRSQVVLDSYKFEYSTMTDSSQTDTNSNQIDIKEISKSNENKVRHFNISVGQAKTIMKNGIGIRQLIYTDNYPEVYPYKKKGIWNYQNFGPLWIPKKSKTIRLNNSSYNFYKDIIRKYERKDISITNGIYMIGKKKITDFTFNNDYYFVLGDNRSNTLDSRYFGFVPESYIEGKVSLILSSSK